MGKRLNPDRGKFERLLFLIKALYKHPRLNVEQLALECSASTRTIFRDLKALTRAGISVESKSGYQLASESIFLPLELSPEEYLTLFWALQSSPVKENNQLGQAGSRILSKIRSHLDRGVELKTGSIKNLLQIAVKQTGLPEKEAYFFAGLQKALSDNIQVQIEYDSPGSGRSARGVDPYALTFRRHAWYLVGFDHQSKEFRVFRLSRIKRLTLKSERFSRDTGFSLEKMFQHSWEVFTGEPVRVKVRFSGKAAKIVASGKRHPSEKIMLQRDGSIYYTATVAGFEEISHWLLSFGAEAEVIEPPELRNWFIQVTKELQQIYGRKYSLVAESRPVYQTRESGSKGLRTRKPPR